MQDIKLYFDLGWQHILSWNALDHILFLVALSAIYLVKTWKNVLILITAFTIGHSITLALSVYDVTRFSNKWVEFFIPCTIIATSISNLFIKDYTYKSLRLNYFLALFFGLIHGMAFANNIRFMLASDEKIGLPLLSFNIGLEVGQIIIVVLVLLCSHLIITILKFPRKLWIFLLSLVAFAVALKFCIKRWPL